MDSFYLFLQLCNKKEDKQNGLRWLIRFLLSHQPIILKSIFHFSYVAQTVIWRTCIRICDENFYQASKLMFTYLFLHKYRITNEIEKVYMYQKIGILSVENNVIRHIILWYEFLRFFLVFTLKWRACKTKQIIKDNVHGNNAMWNETIYMGCFVFRIIIQARIIAFI